MTKKTIDWTQIDPWLRAATSSGSLAMLSKQFGISRWTLGQRRRALGLPELGKGRPPQMEFTERELQIREKLALGYMQKEIAMQMSLTPRSVGSSVERIRQKEKLQALHCETCNGMGVVACNNCFSHGERYPHVHVCPECNGESRVRCP